MRTLTDSEKRAIRYATSGIVLRGGLQKKPLQQTAALLCRRTVRENWLATVAADRAFLAAVVELLVVGHSNSQRE